MELAATVEPMKLENQIEEIEAFEKVDREAVAVTESIEKGTVGTAPRVGEHSAAAANILVVEEVELPVLHIPETALAKKSTSPSAGSLPKTVAFGTAVDFAVDRQGGLPNLAVIPLAGTEVPDAGVVAAYRTAVEFVA